MKLKPWSGLLVRHTEQQRYALAHALTEVDWSSSAEVAMYETSQARRDVDGEVASLVQDQYPAEDETEVGWLNGSCLVWDSDRAVDMLNTTRLPVHIGLLENTDHDVLVDEKRCVSGRIMMDIPGEEGKAWSRVLLQLMEEKPGDQESLYTTEYSAWEWTCRRWKGVAATVASDQELAKGIRMQLTRTRWCTRIREDLMDAIKGKRID